MLSSVPETKTLLLHAPGFPGPSPSLLDAACMLAAACDLAIADAGFRATSIASTANMMAALHELAYQLFRAIPKDLVRGSADPRRLLALMLLQDARLMAAGVQVGEP